MEHISQRILFTYNFPVQVTINVQGVEFFDRQGLTHVTFSLEEYFNACHAEDCYGALERLCAERMGR